MFATTPITVDRNPIAADSILEAAFMEGNIQKKADPRIRRVGVVRT
jgi:hypothetical protein